MPDPVDGARPATWRDVIQHEAESNGIPPALAFAVVDQESGGQPQAVGQPTKTGAQARGFFQLMPETAKAYGVDPTDPAQNIKGGVRLLGELKQRYGGDVAKMLADYHGGPNPANHGPLTRHYVESVLGKLQGGGATPVTPEAPAKTRFKADPRWGMQQLGMAPPAALPDLASGVKPLPQGPAADPTQFEGPTTRTGAALDAVKSAGRTVAEGFNPMHREGRRNLAATAGALTAGTLASPTGPGAVAAGMAGAGSFAAAETAAENWIAGDQQNQTASPVVEGAKQAATELGGHVLSGVVRWPLRVAISSTVGKNAAKGLTMAREATMAQLDAAINAAREHAGAVALAGKQALRATRRDAAGQVLAARTAGKTAIEDATATGAKGIADATASATGILGSAPPRVAVADQVQKAVEGPAQSTLDRLGQQVEAAAKSGPALKLEGTRAKAQSIFDNQLKDLSTYFSGKAPETPEEIEGAQYIRQTVESALRSGKPLSEAEHQRLMDAVATAGGDAGVVEATLESAKHPAMAPIRRILNTPEEVPFAAAHQLKKDLDQGITHWNTPAPKIVEQVTKGIRQSLREDLGVHAPYNAANAEYAKTVKLFTTGHVEQLRKAAIEEPSSFLDHISPKAPQQAQMLKDVLTHTAAQDGPKGAAAGQAAWDSVRSHWTHQNLVSGNLSKLGERIRDLEAQGPDFVKTLYGDPQGQVVLRNLKTIAQGITEAEQRAAAGKTLAETGAKASVAGAKQTGSAMIETAQRAREAANLKASQRVEAMREAKQLGREATDEEVKFKASSLYGSSGPKSAEEHLADAIRAIALGPKTFWGAFSIGRLLKGGPRSADLVYWASHSPRRTQLLVDALTRPEPARATAALLRELGQARSDDAGVIGGPPPGAGDGTDTPVAPTLRPRLGTPPPR